MKEVDVQIKICIGSLNPIKIEAVKIAFSHYFNDFKMFNIKVNSGVPDQPIGIELIIEGAKNRSKRAINYLISEKKFTKNIFGIGIEAGLVEIPWASTNYMDYQFCVIMDESKNLTLGSGIAFEYPQSVIDEVLSNENTEIGDIVGRLANNLNLKNEAGAISFLSKNTITRTEILTQAVICALLPRINKELYY